MKNKIIALLKEHSVFIISFFILAAAFIISRLPFFLYFPIVGYHPDTAVYFLASEGLYHNQWPRFGVVPPLYPLFLWMTNFISNNVLIISVLQTVLSFLAALFFITISYKYLRRLTVFFAIGLSVFYMSSHSIAFDTMLLTESLYTSMLVAICALLIWAVFSDKNGVWVGLSIMLCALFLLRPIGMIAVILLVILFIYFVFNKFSLKKYLFLGLPYIIIIIFSMVYSRLTLGEFIPARLQNYYSKSKTPTFDWAVKSYQGKTPHYSYEEWIDIIEKHRVKPIKEKENGEKVYKSKFMRFLVFLNAVSYESRSFYDNELFRRYNEFYNYAYINKKYHGNSLNIAPFEKDFKKIMFRNYLENLPNINFHQKADVTNPESEIRKSLLFSTYNFVNNNIILPLFKTKIWIILMAMVIVISILKLYKTKLRDKESFIVLFFVSILFATGVFMVFTGHNTGNWRYTYPTVFIFYIVPVFLLILLKYNKKKCSTTKP